MLELNAAALSGLTGPAGGLIFHAGTTELVLRAHDADSGEVLARFDLPAGLHAGPITYKLREVGKQYLVIAPGGSHRARLRAGRPRDRVHAASVRT